MANIGERIRKIRLLRNMTQGELAVAIGFEDNDYGRGRVSKYERGIRVPKEDMLIKISKALNINSYYLSQGDHAYALDLAYELFDWDDVLPFKFKKDEDGSWVQFDEQYFGDFINEWMKMNHKYINGDISLEKYREWKYQYGLKSKIK